MTADLVAVVSAEDGIVAQLERVVAEPGPSLANYLQVPDLDPSGDPGTLGVESREPARLCTQVDRDKVATGFNSCQQSDLTCPGAELENGPGRATAATSTAHEACCSVHGRGSSTLAS